MKKVFILLVFCYSSNILFAQEDGRKVISLNGEWEFDQTKTAFPPTKFTRKLLMQLSLERRMKY